MKRVAIVQSNYIPWKGYFDLIRSVDEFILIDDVQYTRRDWRNRNMIKTPQGKQWLTIPVVVKGKFDQKIMETEVSSEDWGQTHWRTLVANYSKSGFFKKLGPEFEEIYRTEKSRFLSQINYRFLMKINELLGIKTVLRWSMDYPCEAASPSQKLLKLCLASGASHYTSGPAAREYLDVEIFRRENIEVEWFNYEGYPEYPQLYPPFDHFVSILDLIFNMGPRAIDYMKVIKA